MNPDTNQNITVKSAFDVLKEIPALKYEVTESAVKTARAAFETAKVALPKTKDGGEMTDNLLVAMGNAADIARNVDDGLTRLSYLIGASIVSKEWETLYPIVKKDGQSVLRAKPFKNQTEFISYMLPDTARSTALNYVSAAVNVLLPAKMGLLPELPECANMTIGMASNIKSAIVDKDVKPVLIKEVAKLHKAKGSKDAPLTRNEWKTAIKNAKEEIGKTKPRDTTNVAATNLVETTAGINTASYYYSLLSALNATKGEGMETIKCNAEQTNKLRNLVTAAMDSHDDALLFMEAFNAVLNGGPLEIVSEN